MNSTQKKSIVAGTMITAGSCIGAGIFSLPVVASGMWFPLSMVALLVLWMLNYLISLILLEVTSHFEPGANMDTFVRSILGNGWNMITGLAIAFLMYILLYAYFSAFGSMGSNMLGLDASNGGGWTRGILSFGMGMVLAAAVWTSTAFVGKIATILVFGMAISYAISMGGLSMLVEGDKLFNRSAGSINYLPYVWKGLPYFLTAFGFASIVPSLYKYYGKSAQVIKRSLFFGSFIAFVTYVIFIFICFGTITRTEFIAINEAGGNMGTLVGALTKNSSGNTLNLFLTMFSNFAIISSFLGVGLGLFDYIADKFKFSDDAKGRFYTACLTFLPPGVACFFFPNGFIFAIGFAGLALAFAFIFVPILMVWKLRKGPSESDFTLFGGNTLLLIILFLAIVVVSCQILSMLGQLPKLG